MNKTKIKCDECDGKGWKNHNCREGNLLSCFKKWCEKCEGRGELPYDGDRNGIEWERE